MNTALKVLVVVLWVAPVLGCAVSFCANRGHPLQESIGRAITLTLAIVFLAGMLVATGSLLFIAAVNSWTFLTS